MWQTNAKKLLSLVSKVYISSDSQFILDEAEAMGCIGILRSERLCGDTPNIDVYQHASTFMEGDKFIAVQANSPTIDINTIIMTKKLLEMGVDEVMTCHEDYSLYGSVWAMTMKRLEDYKDAYKPTPEVLIKDLSVDIHTRRDYLRAIYGK